MDNRADRSSGNSTLRGKLGSRIDDLEFVEVIYLNIEMFFDDIISQNKIRRKWKQVRSKEEFDFNQ